MKKRAVLKRFILSYLSIKLKYTDSFKRYQIHSVIVYVDLHIHLHYIA